MESIPIKFVAARLQSPNLLLQLTPKLITRPAKIEMRLKLQIKKRACFLLERETFANRSEKVGQLLETKKGNTARLLAEKIPVPYEPRTQTMLKILLILSHILAGSAL